MEHQQYGVILDEASFNRNDLDLSRLLAQLDQWQRYELTKPSQVIERLQKATVVVANKVVFSRSVIEALPQLKVILLTATGMDNVDQEACEEHHVKVYNVNDYCTSAVAQHVLALMLSLSVNLNRYSDNVKQGEWSKSTSFSLLCFPISELAGKTLGLIGYGTLAKGVERLALAFDMKIIIANRSNAKPKIGRLDLNEVLSQADFISLHCPLTPSTKGLMNDKAFKRMKPTAVLINTARGAIVDSLALANALRQGEIGGAGIDVLEQEPPPADHVLLSADIPNLMLTPHTAWASLEARQRLLDKVADNLLDWSRANDC